jgi:MFS transporter, FHS family, glucose/mannose:H+ symporter
VLVGFSLASFFPATRALLMAERPAARQAGIVFAVSGLGTAALPWMMGVVSTRAGSLQVALALPLGAALGLLGISWFGGRPPYRRPSAGERITEVWMVWSCRWELPRR